MASMFTSITLGALHAVCLPPRWPTSLWGHIAVVNCPGVPFLIDRNCLRNSLIYVSYTPQIAIVSSNLDSLRDQQ